MSPGFVAPALVATLLDAALRVAIGGESLGVLASALTAAVGLFVAYQAYRGFRRNESRPMLYLAIGIFLVTTVSFVASHVVVVALGTSDAVALLVRTLLDVAGLSAILYALTGA